MKLRVRKYAIVILDIIIINFNLFIAFAFRFGFDSKLDLTDMEGFLIYFIPIAIIKIVVFKYFNLYKSLWKYASIDELLQIFNGVVLGNALAVTFIFIAQVPGFPRSIIILTGIFDLLLVGASRLSYRVLRRYKFKIIKGQKGKKKVLVIGAGEAGSMIVKELINHTNLSSIPIGFLDDDEYKYGKKIAGLPVLGKIKDVEEILSDANVSEIIIAMPSVSQQRIHQVVKLMNQTGKIVKILPHMNSILKKELGLNDLREVDIEDLLGRDPVDLDLASVEEFIKDKTILITGGGGSIGSELCRQVARYRPKSLLVFDIYENNAYDIQNELLAKYGRSINLEVLIGSVRDKERVKEVFDANSIDIVFHAAAHKHVPLMEVSPKEAIKNNIFGTMNVAELAGQYDIEKFVLVSTDKAVNPTNIMGATKRVCELAILQMNQEYQTEYGAVRFGNVLGSNGSVIPLFKKQIQAGGPVTVTDKNVIRYFMTISEASSLVIQAGAMAKGGEVFILDMGQPTKIIDLAKDLITLAGYKPYDDIPIEIIGLRPGEKMFEELLVNTEQQKKTSNEKIFIENNHSFKQDDIIKQLESLDLSNMNRYEVYDFIKRLVDTFTYDDIK